MISVFQTNYLFFPGDRNAYDEVISGEAETLDILTFVKEHMENGSVMFLL